MKIPKVGIIGSGFIGQGVRRACMEIGWNVSFILRSEYIDFFENAILECTVRRNEKICTKAFSGVDIIFLCIPTLDDGAKAVDYIFSAINANVPIVTAEKGSWGNYGELLLPFKDRIGSSAVVGGSTMILPFLSANLPADFNVLRLVINGTCNYILFMMGLGYDFETATKMAKQLGYAEPNSNDPLGILNGEICGDISMKIAALNNFLQLTPGLFLDAKSIKAAAITPSLFRKIEKGLGSYRYIVSIVRRGSRAARLCSASPKRIPIIELTFGDFLFYASFENVEEEPFSKLVLPGVNNGVLINDTGRVFPNNHKEIGAPGAGIKTVDAMMSDARRMLIL